MCYEKKLSFNFQTRNEPFLIVIYHSSLVKDAMNAAHVRKLRNGCSARDWDGKDYLRIIPRVVW